MHYLKSLLSLIAIAACSVAFAQVDTADLVAEIEANPTDLESIIAMAVADNPGQANEIVEAALAAFPEEADRIAGSAIAGLEDKSAANVREIVRLAVAANPGAVDDIISAASAAAPDQVAAIEAGAQDGLTAPVITRRVPPRGAPYAPTPGVAIDASIISPAQ